MIMTMYDGLAQMLCRRMKLGCRTSFRLRIMRISDAMALPGFPLQSMNFKATGSPEGDVADQTAPKPPSPSLRFSVYPGIASSPVYNTARILYQTGRSHLARAKRQPRGRAHAPAADPLLGRCATPAF